MVEWSFNTGNPGVSAAPGYTVGARGRSTMLVTSPAFKENAARAMADAGLQKALARTRPHFPAKRAAAVAALPEFEALREAAKHIKDHTLANLDFYLETFAANVERAGGQVHWCATAEEARAAVLAICRSVGARSATKGKSMVSEEIGLNEFLAANGVAPVETDLGEYILQLRHEPPSHIIAPAFHLNREDWEESFRRAHTDLPADRVFRERRDILTEARTRLREKFLAADVGITGANFLVAETGSSVIVTNEGNGDLTQTLPRVHIVLAGIEKVVPTLEDTTTLLRLLARSATGQDFSVYTTFSTGPRRASDADGPEAYHVILLDNGRSAMVGTQFQDMLRCIRCAACLNHCPVYGTVGGHSYGWVYPGPMGAVLTPSLIGIDQAGHLPNATTFCGKCESVCPMKIPLPKMMRHWREREFERHLTPAVTRTSLGLWAWFARRPGPYRLATRAAMAALGLLGRRRGRFRSLPLAGGWTNGRDLPAPEGDTFFARYARAQRKGLA
jgi:L-lactate dehydrogenase complex protein LldF